MGLLVIFWFKLTLLILSSDSVEEIWSKDDAFSRANWEYFKLFQALNSPTCT